MVLTCPNNACHKRVLEWIAPGMKEIARERRICCALEIGKWTNTEE
jgi:hypothetical protein